MSYCMQISQFRIRDWHILTNGLVRLPTDDRFNVFYKEGSFNWILQVCQMLPMTCSLQFSFSTQNKIEICILKHLYCFQIKFAQDRDAGIYECQVSTSTGTISRRVNLNVIFPEAFIKGGEEYHVDEGSPISLTCVIGRDIKQST